MQNGFPPLFAPESIRGEVFGTVGTDVEEGAGSGVVVNGASGGVAEVESVVERVEGERIGVGLRQDVAAEGEQVVRDAELSEQGRPAGRKGCAGMRARRLPAG